MGYVCLAGMFVLDVVAWFVSELIMVSRWKRSNN